MFDEMKHEHHLCYVEGILLRGIREETCEMKMNAFVVNVNDVTAIHLTGTVAKQRRRNDEGNKVYRTRTHPEM
jgi:hypothetical protein